MPGASSVGKTKRDYLCHDVSPSVVSLLRYPKESDVYIDFGSGFVLYDNGSKAVILTSAEVFDEDEERIYICFHDGTVKEASVFVTDVRSVYTSLVVDSTASSKAVEFSATDVARGDFVYTIARALPEIKRPGMYAGSVTHPRCFSADLHSGRPVNKYDDFFALSCPVAGPFKELNTPDTMIRLIGTPVFNLRTKFVGIIEKSSSTKYDLKFARHLSSVIDELKILFGGNNWKEALVSQLMNMTSRH